MPGLKRTAFFEIHKSLGAKLVPFAGWEMPVQYKGIIAEHMAVRNSVGVFDVSHMGEFFITGPDALKFVQMVTTNDASKLSEGKVQYSAACYKDGGVVDDLLVYCINDNEFMMVVNAANITKDFEWFQSNLNESVLNAKLEDKSDNYSLLAVQGQNCLKTIQKITDIDLSAMKYYTFTNGTVGGVNVTISRTGYTGEAMGFEILSSSSKEDSEKLWNAIFEAGKEFEIQPVGLGARDTLRLEAGYCLYGNDIDNTTNTIEAGLGWITKPDKGDFNGKEKIISELTNGVSRRLRGFIVQDKLVARRSYEIYSNISPSGSQRVNIGIVTSGSYSPVLEKNIGLGYIEKEHSKIGNKISVKIRNSFVPAEIVKIPFISKQ